VLADTTQLSQSHTDDKNRLLKLRRLFSADIYGRLRDTRAKKLANKVSPDLATEWITRMIRTMVVAWPLVYYAVQL